jgi:hypothetical protein
MAMLLRRQVPAGNALAQVNHFLRDFRLNEDTRSIPGCSTSCLRSAASYRHAILTT